MVKNGNFGKNRQKRAKKGAKLDGRLHFMGKYHIQELYTWKIAYIAYFQDRVKKMSSRAVYSVFLVFLGTP